MNVFSQFFEIYQSWSSYIFHAIGNFWQFLNPCEYVWGLDILLHISAADSHVGTPNLWLECICFSIPTGLALSLWICSIRNLSSKAGANIYSSSLQEIILFQSLAISYPKLHPYCYFFNLICPKFYNSLNNLFISCTSFILSAVYNQSNASTFCIQSYIAPNTQLYEAHYLKIK